MALAQRICIDCKWYRANHRAPLYSTCCNLLAQGSDYLVSREFVMCMTARRTGQPCGPDGKLFEGVTE